MISHRIGVVGRLLWALIVVGAAHAAARFVWSFIYRSDHGCNLMYSCPRVPRWWSYHPSDIWAVIGSHLAGAVAVGIIWLVLFGIWCAVIGTYRWIFNRPRWIADYCQGESGCPCKNHIIDAQRSQDMEDGIRQGVMWGAIGAIAGSIGNNNS